MTQDQDNSNRQSSNESSSLYEAAHNLVNAFNQYVWPQRAESNQLNISSSSSSNNNNSQAFVGTSFRNRYLVGNRQYSLVQDKGVQTDPIDMIIRDLKREDNKNEKNTLKLVEADHQRVISLENEITRMKKQLVLQGVSFHTPSSLGNQKVTKPRQPILAHSLAGARRVMPESGFVRSLYSPQANKTDDRHKITMQSIVKEIPKPFLI
ncbi:hypothetical protein PHYBLDRAFT_73784 [Phycomyces blakesleeanus NRRL 1555(-)]|uniref:Uncharacterized protein n=1 Tax=Phycomyces blakesleeanus (strain ATCC 8743b / DSM 1359 / FGSC 10004 / NBRC 33097 / NRRL 1555) TaxID=763407 RepID=A0A167J451_PHYB8|nr:hypothetical protein PHYBLDRAFT_73784 [Phycomyces blakesleeanus NRRL 1555(-)]OAD65099.1 hypothetical protein PHYBLDRAFT_73784 [Phycomyces blakesleeanus NRRL 1555(-)]|eukprot:XP_018283139.1 hypothetical protein PHYBLDRAFT_73784 [Phycomyces blakesleeanus NRRL 1555(-)]